MPDDRPKIDLPARERINAEEAYEVRDWARKLGVTEPELRGALRRVGPIAKDVARALGKGA